MLGILLSLTMAAGTLPATVYAAPNATVAENNSADTEGSTAGNDAQGALGTSSGTENGDAASGQTGGGNANREAITVTDEFQAYTVNAAAIDLSDVDGAVPADIDDVEVDKNDPVISTVEEELDGIKVLNDDGKKVPLTEEQKKTVLAMYKEYQDAVTKSAHVLGVQNPFFLTFNDNGEDGLGILGEMLALSNVSVDDVRNGNYAYDDLTGMIMNFTYGTTLGVEYYGANIQKARDAALKAVKDSGAQTEAQKLLVLNDWLAHKNTFDMAYIMNASAETDEDKSMVAPDPQKGEHYDDVYKVIYEVYEKQLTAQFHDQIYDGVKTQFRQQYYENAIRKMVSEGIKKDNPDISDADLDTQVDAYMEENADAISKDADAFVKENYGEDVAAQLAAGADEFIASAESDGVEVDPENAPGVKMKIEDITQQQMDQPLDDLQGMSPNQAIPVYADMAAQGMTEGILGYWEGSLIGAIGRSGSGNSVCLGYAQAYSYLVQCMHPEIYLKDATADLNNYENWKTPQELYYNESGELDINKGYVSDLVRITFDADVSMYGEVQEDFSSDHFWNAVKVDGTWYYVDPCYTDVYTEVMMRDRVESDGDMNHLYFLFSHNSAVSMYDGNYKEIKTLYENEATDKHYEDSWMSRIVSNTYSDGNYYYYMYDSTDTITMMEDFNNNSWDTTFEDAEYKIVRHKITGEDAAEVGDTDYEALIEFNYKADEDADETVTRVYNPSTGEMEENEELTELYAQFVEEQEIYPSIKITTALYNGKLYFNISNRIMSYDLSDGTVALVKEYNTVSATRDKTAVFGGMAFNIVDSAEGADFTVENHPITSLTIKEDGKMYVSIATNFAYISGKDPHNASDKNSYGWEFEESNYNPDYSNYDIGDIDSSMMEQFGYTEEVNDNDEFMWSANFVESIDMGHLTGGSHSYEEVTVDPFCGRNGYTENRCTVCGTPEEGSRKEAEDTALDHHYIHFDEEYYTKDDEGNWNKDECYVCAMCGSSIMEPTKPKENANWGDTGTSYEEQLAEYEKEKAIWDEAVETAGHDYVPTDAQWAEDNKSVTFSKLACSNVCVERANLLDCLIADGKSSVDLEAPETAEAELTGYSGDCETGAVQIYTASGKAGDYEYTATKEVAGEAGKHTYEGTFTWTEAKDADGNVTGYTAVADLTCAVCGDEQKGVEASVVKNDAESKEPNCTDAGKTVYTATAAVKNEAGEEIGSVSENKEIEIPAKGHQYENGKCTVCGAEEPSLDAPGIVSVYSRNQETVKVTWSKVDGAVGYQLWRAESEDAAEDAWVPAKTIREADFEKYTNEDGDLQYVNNNLEVGKTYYYKVRAFKLNSASADIDDEAARVYSDFSAVDHMPAAVVFGDVYSNATSKIRINWNGVKGAHGFQIWRKSGDGEWTVTKTLGDKGNTLTNDQGTATAYSNCDLEAGTKYTYKIRAFYIPEDGKKVFGAYSDELEVVVTPKATKVTAKSSKSKAADISWDKVANADGYQVLRADSKDGTYQIVKTIKDGKTTSYTNSGLTSKKTYYYKVRAYVDNGSYIGGKNVTAFSETSSAVSVTVK